MRPIQVLRTRMECRRQLRKLGYSGDKIDSVIDAVDGDEITATLAEVGGKVGAFGDGTIINAIIEFFKSPEGQALIAALVKMLIAMLAGL